MSSQPKRPKAFANDAQSAQFLYLILKQLDLKSVNWQSVADGLGIKNGHAARMRWSRYKLHAEGGMTEAKSKPLNKPSYPDKGKGDKRLREEDRSDLKMEDDYMGGKRVKHEYGYPPQPGFYPGPSAYGFLGPQQNSFLPPQPQYLKPDALLSQDMNFFGQGQPPFPAPFPPPQQQWQPSAARPPPMPFNSLPASFEDPDDRPIRQCQPVPADTISMNQLHLQSPRPHQYSQLGPATSTYTVSGLHMRPSASGSSASPVSIVQQPRIQNNAQTFSTDKAARVCDASGSMSNASPRLNNRREDGFPRLCASNVNSPAEVKVESKVVELHSPKIKVEPGTPQAPSTAETRPGLISTPSTLPESQQTSAVEGVVDHGVTKIQTSDEGESRMQSLEPTNSTSTTDGRSQQSLRASIQPRDRPTASIQPTLFDFFRTTPAMTNRPPPPWRNQTSEPLLQDAVCPPSTPMQLTTPSPPHQSTAQPSITNPEALQSSSTSCNEVQPSSDHNHALIHNDGNQAMNFEFHNLFQSSFDGLFAPVDEMEYDFQLDELISGLPSEQSQDASGVQNGVGEGVGRAEEMRGVQISEEVSHLRMTGRAAEDGQKDCDAMRDVVMWSEV